MPRFNSKLIETFKPARKNRPARRSDRRRKLVFESFEDRVVLSPAAAAIGALYAQLGGQWGILGAPTTGVTPISGGYDETFQHGAIFYSSGTGAHDLVGATATEYFHTANEKDAFGNDVQGILGFPTANQGNDPGVSGAQIARFQGGQIYSSSATGAHVVYGAILAEYQATANEKDFYGHDVQTVIGLPTTDEASVPGVAAGRVTDFQNGAIYWSARTGAHVVYGAIYARFTSIGGASYFGLPTTDETETPDGLGRYNHFETIGPGGSGALAAIDWTPNYGAHTVTGPILALFASNGWEQDGEAISNQVNLTATGGAYQYFHRKEDARGANHGTPFVVVPYAIDYTANTGAYVTDTSSYTDIEQGFAGTCWILASIAAMEAQGVDLSQRIHYQGNDTYTVQLYVPNDPATRPYSGYSPITVSVNFNGSLNSADPGYSPSEPSQSWVVVMQRAIIEAVATWSPGQTITNPHGGAAFDAQTALIGKAIAYLKVKNSNIQQQVESALANRQYVVFSTSVSTTQLVGDHDYAVLSANSQGVTLYNPWGAAQTSPTPDPQTVSWSVIAQDGDGFSIA
jgi:hypothetical protein